MIEKADKDILKLAAKAARYKANGSLENSLWLSVANDNTYQQWNPLTNNDDALRLAIHLKIDIGFFIGSRKIVASPVGPPVDPVFEPFGDDHYAATRRAIVRAAAKIGRTMP